MSFAAERQSLDDERQSINEERQSMNVQRQSLNQQRQSTDDQRQSMSDQQQDIIDQSQNMNDQGQYMNDQGQYMNEQEQYMNEQEQYMNEQRQSLNDQLQSMSDQQQDTIEQSQSMNDQLQSMSDQRQSESQQRKSIYEQRQSINDQRSSLYGPRKSTDQERKSLNEEPNPSSESDTCGINDNDISILVSKLPTLKQDSAEMDDEVIITDPSQRPPILNRIFKFIDANCATFVGALTEAVGIRSISAWPEARKECFRMVQWTAEKLETLGFLVELRRVGNEEIRGKKVPIPPIILASLGDDPNRPTLLIYGHLDVQPAKQSDGWGTDPFFLTERDGRLYGRGASDDKGPVLGWIHAIQAYLQSSRDLPVNIKLIFESMLECGSEGLNDLLRNQKNEFLADVDVVAMSDNYWLSQNRPCITYGMRGLCYFFVEVECGSKDLHSGVFGGAVREALPDLIWLLDQLVDDEGTILVPGIMDNVCPVTLEEEELYENIDFDLDYYKEETGVIALKHEGDKRATLMARWRFPSLTIHGIQGACGEPGSKTIIPRKVIGKFSIRLVPNQKPDRIEKMISDYLQEKWIERGSPNTLKCYMADDGIQPWVCNPFHLSYKAARQATAWAYECIPDMTREGGTLERFLALQEVIGKNILLIPMGSCDDQPHSRNEKINVENYITGTKLFSALIYEIGQLEKTDF